MSTGPHALLEAWESWKGGIDCEQTGRCWSAEELRVASSRLCTELSRTGLAPGDLVALLISNTVAFPVALVAVLQRGAHPVLLPTGTRSAELERQALQCGIGWALHDFLDVTSGLDPEQHSGIATLDAATLDLSLLDLGESVPVPPEQLDPAGVLLHPTSGTYGHASFCVRDQRVAVAEGANFLARITPYAGIRMRVTTPLSHAYAFGFGLVASVLSHGTLVIDSHLNPRRLLALEQEDPSQVLALVPPVARLLAELGARVPSPRMAPLVFYAGAPCPDPVREAFEGVFPSRLLAIYGSTETGAIASSFTAGPGTPQVGVGRPLPGVQVSLRDPQTYQSLGDGVGEVVVRSSSMMQGYWRATERWIETGAFPTGDLGRLVGDQLVLVGRVKEMINLGGLKVDPAEVEAVLHSHPNVIEAAVYPGLRPDGQELVQAAVVLHDPDLGTESLRAHCLSRLSESKVPVRLHTVQALPRTPSGKCLRIRCPDFPVLSG
ncbi:MAG: class I adenylate-forming enzyme family protein, partial [Myxococcota bacterium]|nr:class I adenylate-forming enzyme family protein [Myxococcota bacterium]